MTSISKENILAPDQIDVRAVLALIGSIQSDLDRLRGLLQPRMPETDARDPRNKTHDGKLTARGIELCYRLFEAGKTPYAVGSALGISFGAAKHRQGAWQRVGGVNRVRMPLD